MDDVGVGCIASHSNTPRNIGRISTASLEDKIGISSISRIIDDLCLRWAGHVARMDEARLPRGFLTSWVHANRRIDRPYKSTIHRIEDTIRLTGTHDSSRVCTRPGVLKAVVHGLSIKIGADRPEERCSRCKRDGTVKRPLYICDSRCGAGAWHAHCLLTHSQKLLVLDRWFCPNCQNS